MTNDEWGCLFLINSNANRRSEIEGKAELFCMNYDWLIQFFEFWLVEKITTFKFDAKDKKIAILSTFLKIFYDWTTSSAAFCAIQWMSLSPLFQSMQLK